MNGSLKIDLWRLMVMAINYQEASGSGMPYIHMHAHAHTHTHTHTRELDTSAAMILTLLQWNLGKWTPLRKPPQCGQEAAVPNYSLIVYCTLRPPYSGNIPTLKYRHWSHIPKEKINTNFPLKTDSLMQDQVTGVRKLSWKIFAFLEDFSHFYSFYVLRPLCTRGALNFQTRGIRWLVRVVTLPGALSI